MTGFIGVGQLRYILTNLGEKMSDDEVDELLKAVETSPNGDVNYTGMSTSRVCGPLHQQCWGIQRRKRESSANLATNRPRPHDPCELEAPRRLGGRN